jgi:DNA-binding NarL/FixJ family response regulator
MNQPAAIKVVLVESQRLVREALQCLLQATGEIVVVGEAAAAQDLFETIEAHRPDVALLSLDARGDRDSGLLQELWLDRAQTADVVNRLTNTHSKDDPEARKMASLTPRERQIVALVAEGLKNRAIAERLSISEATARNHLTSILDKLELSNRFQLAVFAFRQGLISCPQIPSLMKEYSTAGTDAAAAAGPPSRAADRQNSDPSNE